MTDATPSAAPFFSVITVSLNNLAGLTRTHESLTAQTGRDFEWIVVDGGSGDGSADFLETTDARWTSEADSGIYDAMNKGMTCARGQYLLFLNAGDALAGADVLARIKEAAAGFPDFIYGDALEAFPDQVPHAKKARSHTKIAYGMFTHHQAMLYRRGALDGLAYDTNYKIAADYDFTMRFLRRNPDALYCALPICLFESGGVSQTQATLGRAEQCRIRKDFTGRFHNAIITAAQWALWQVRTACPALYWRFKR